MLGGQLLEKVPSTAATTTTSPTAGDLARLGPAEAERRRRPRRLRHQRAEGTGPLSSRRTRRRNGVSDAVHDHTLVLATIEAKWNLAALTRRDANAATVIDLRDVEHAAFLETPVITGPSRNGPAR